MPEPSNGFLALKETFSTRRRDAICLARAYAKGTIFTINNPEAAVRILYEVFPEVKPTRKDETTAVREDIKVLQARIPKWKLENAGLKRWGESSEANYTEYANFLLKWGVIRQKADAKDLITHELIDEINKFDPGKIAADGNSITNEQGQNSVRRGPSLVDSSQDFLCPAYRVGNRRHCRRNPCTAVVLGELSRCQDRSRNQEHAEFENAGLALASDTEAYVGHLGKVRELTKRAVDSAVRADSKETGAVWQAIAAQREAAYGYAAEARQSAAEALKLAPTSQGVESEAALAFAMASDTGRAESLAQDLGKRFPLDTQMQSLWLPAIQAQLALERKNPTPALNALRASSAIELGYIPFVANVSCLYHVYVRGDAYLAAGQGNAAAAEFQKILDHSGIVLNCWTDADPDIPILKEAKAEYAKMQ